MRILFVCGAGIFAGRESVTLSLIKGLRDLGHDVMVVTSHWGNGEFADRLVDESIPYLKLPLGFISKTLSWPAIRMTLHQSLLLPRLWLGYLNCKRNYRPDAVVHSNMHHVFLLLPFLSERSDVYHVHNSVVYKGFYRWLHRLFQQRLAVLVGVSEAVSRSLRRIGVPPAKVITVYNGFDIETGQLAFGEKEAEPPSSQRAPSEGGVCLGIVGQVAEWKGHHVLIDALGILRNQGLSVELHIFGQGQPAYMNRLENRILELDLRERVTWEGFVSDKNEIYSGIDIVVVPSLWDESLSMSAVEASAYGIPLVASNRGGLPEVVVDGETGYLVCLRGQDSSAQLAEKLRTLINDPGLRRRMGEAAKNLVLGRFSSRAMAESMQASLKRLAKDA